MLFICQPNAKNEKKKFLSRSKCAKRESDSSVRQVALVSERQNGTGNAAADSEACLKTKESHSCHRVICILLTLHPFTAALSPLSPHYA